MHFQTHHRAPSTQMAVLSAENFQDAFVSGGSFGMWQSPRWLRVRSRFWVLDFLYR